MCTAIPEKVQEDLGVTSARCVCKTEDRRTAFINRRKRVILLVLSYISCSPAHFSPHSKSPLMLYLHKEDIVESRMDESRLWGKERNRPEDSRIKAKKRFCLGRSARSEKGKKICLSFIVN